MQFSKRSGIKSIYLEEPRILVIQTFRNGSLAWPIRVRLKEAARKYIIVRNLESTNVAQIAFTTATNDNANPPTTGFVDINPNEEWYEVGSENQVWIRPKVDLNPVSVEVETLVLIG